MQEYIPFFQGEKRSIAEKLAKYFEYSGLESKIHYDEKNDVYILSVPAHKEKEAKKHYQAFYFVERDRIDKKETDNAGLEDINEGDIANDTLFEDSYSKRIGEEIAASNMDDINSDSDDDSTPIDKGDNSDNDCGLASASYNDIVDNTLSNVDADSTLDDSLVHSPLDDKLDEDALDPPSSSFKSLLSESGTYVMKTEKYNDYTGTFYIFLLLGFAGIIFVILNIVGLINFLNGFFPNLIMGSLFLFFIYEAISSGKKANNLKLEIEEENKLTDKINEWLHSTITEDFLESISDSNLSEELDYLKKTETIRDMLISEFGDQNRDYLDRIIEEFYTETFDASTIYTEEAMTVDTSTDSVNGSDNDI